VRSYDVKKCGKMEITMHGLTYAWSKVDPVPTIMYDLNYLNLKLQGKSRPWECM